MNNSAKKITKTRSAILVLLTVIFFVFGFCPLRNTLNNWLQPAQTGASTVPEYAKVISHDTCKSAVINKTIQTTGKTFGERKIGLGALSKGGDWQIQSRLTYITATKLYAIAPAFCSTPIYLRNQCLLI